MTQREKLIDLLENAPAAPNGERNVATLANHLLENGVIVPPCKVGQSVWILTRNYDSKKNSCSIEVVECVISSFRVNQLNQFFTAHYMDSEISIHPSEIGESVFLTYDEADKARAERSKDEK